MDVASYLSTAASPALPPVRANFADALLVRYGGDEPAEPPSRPAVLPTGPDPLSPAPQSYNPPDEPNALPPTPKPCQALSVGGEGAKGDAVSQRRQSPSTSAGGKVSRRRGTETG